MPPFGNKKTSATNFFVTEAVKKRIYRGSTPVYNLSGRKNPASFNGDFRKTILAVLKKTAFPLRAHRVHFAVLKASELSASVHISGACAFGYFSRSSHL